MVSGAAMATAGSIRSDSMRSPSHLGPGLQPSVCNIGTALLPRLPRLVNAERTEAVGAQLRISDRAAFLSHPRGTEAAVGLDKIVVLLPLTDVLRRVSRHFAYGCGLVGTG